jgi:hypothetical protein
MMEFKIVLFIVAACLVVCSNCYDLGKAYVYEYESRISVGYSQQQKFALKKLPLVYKTKARVYVEVTKTSTVEFVAKVESLESSLYSAETKNALLNEEFSFEVDKLGGRVGKIWFGEAETEGSKLFKKSFIDHFNYGNSEVCPENLAHIIDSISRLVQGVFSRTFRVQE